MFTSFSLKGKLLLIGICLTVIPLCITCLATLRQTNRITQNATSSSLSESRKNLEQIVKSICTLCESRHHTVRQHVEVGLNIARTLLYDAGKVTFSEEVFPWTAVNQFTKDSEVVHLNRMMVGGIGLGPEDNKSDRYAIVDNAKQANGGTFTIFQRMNEQGDMLRISTNVLKDDGTRAVGTYIPAINPDGQRNEVLSSVLTGKKFIGRAFVVNNWYITAYEPIYDDQRRVTGMLYAGVPQDEENLLREHILKTVIGETGYIYILNSKGKYIISKDGKRDGEDIWQAKDSFGTLFIQEICKKALALNEGEVAEHRYPWQNQGEASSRYKIAKIGYFGPWDWVIGAGAYEDEIFKNKTFLEAMGKKGIRNICFIILFSLVGSAITWFITAGKISNSINGAILEIDLASVEVSSASDQLGQSSLQISSNTSQQAAAIQETSSSVEEITSMTKQNADHAQQAEKLTQNVSSTVNQVNDAVEKLSNAMIDISNSSKETGKIIKTIDEIAFQTNLLALNAAVEAARAGEAGAGFAVVADEVRNLALRAATSANETSELIEKTVNDINSGSDYVSMTSNKFKDIVEGVEKLAGLMSEIASASNEQADGLVNINKAVTEIDDVIQRNSADSEELASASEELNGQAQMMKNMVVRLGQIVSGRAEKRIESAVIKDS